MISGNLYIQDVSNAQGASAPTNRRNEMTIISEADARSIGDEDFWCDIVEAINNDDAVNIAEKYAADVVEHFGLSAALFYANAIEKLTNMVRSGDYPDVEKSFYAAGFAA
jgi:hypothetical protein